jgi:hypothetical protein
MLFAMSIVMLASVRQSWVGVKNANPIFKDHACFGAILRCRILKNKILHI